MSDLALLGQLAPTLNALLQPSLEQAGLILADYIKGWRLSNLASILEKVDQKLEERGFDLKETTPIKLSVGLPIIERASCEDDEDLQELWANLIVSSATGEESGEFRLNATYVEILHQFSTLDCEVLKFVMDNGFEGNEIHDDGSQSILTREIEPQKIEKNGQVGPRFAREADCSRLRCEGVERAPKARS